LKSEIHLYWQNWYH